MGVECITVNVKYPCEVLYLTVGSIQLSYYSVVNLFELFCLTDVYSYDIGQLKAVQYIVQWHSYPECFLYMRLTGH